MDNVNRTSSVGIAIVKVFSLFLIGISLIHFLYVIYPYLFKLAASANNGEASSLAEFLTYTKFYMKQYLNVTLLVSYISDSISHYINVSLVGIFLLICAICSFHLKKWARSLLICFSGVYFFWALIRLIYAYITPEHTIKFDMHIDAFFYQIIMPPVIIVFYLLPSVKKIFNDNDKTTFTLAIMPLPVLLLSSFYIYGTLSRIYDLFTESYGLVWGFMLVANTARVFAAALLLLNIYLAVGIYKRSMLAWKIAFGLNLFFCVISCF